MDGLLNEAAEFALRKLERSHAYHDRKASRIKAQDAAYEGILDESSEAASWQSDLHPPLLNHSIETALTMLLDDDIKFKVTPLPKLYEGKEWDIAVAGADAFEKLIRQQLINAKFNEFQRPFILQAAIRRFSVAKVHWREETARVKELQVKPLLPGPLSKISPVRLREVEVTKTLFDGPCVEVVDVRDFYWDEAATRLENSRWCAHAVWMSPADIQALAKAGVYRQAAADLLVQSAADNQAAPDGGDIERDREERSRKNGLIEVLELWDKDNLAFHVIGARKALLAQSDFPFWHRQYPFIEMSLAPFPFSIQGLSLVEKLAPLQEAYWSLLNQTRDNVKLMNNAIVLLASDYDDPDSFNFSPGAINTVDRPEQVQFWTPKTEIATLAMPLMQQLTQDMQSLAMGQPISIPIAGRVTATEVATMSQIAQTAASKMKDQITYAYRRIGHQIVGLDQQYVRKPQQFIRLGLDSAPEVEEIAPQLFQGDFGFELTPSTESNVRAERRAEAQALLQTAVQAAPVFAAMKTPLNMKPYMDKVLDAFDVENKDEFYASQGPAGIPGMQPEAPQGAAGGGEGAGPGGEAVGVTAPQSIDPSVSPSSQSSLSAGVMQARAMASQGGFQSNGGGG